MSIGGSCQDVLSGAQNHLDGLRNDCEGCGVPVPPPPNLDSLKQRERLRHMVKSFGAPSGVDFRHFSIMPVRGAAKRVKVWESKGYISSGWGGPGHTENRVKCSLTESQALRLLCIGGRWHLGIVRSIQSTEKSHDKRNTHRPDRAGAACRHCHGGFGSCCPVCDADRVGALRGRGRAGGRRRRFWYRSVFDERGPFLVNPLLDGWATPLVSGVVDQS